MLKCSKHSAPESLINSLLSFHIYAFVPRENFFLSAISALGEILRNIHIVRQFNPHRLSSFLGMSFDLRWRPIFLRFPIRGSSVLENLGRARCGNLFRCPIYTNPSECIAQNPLEFQENSSEHFLCFLYP